MYVCMVFYSSAITGVIGSLQALECMKLLLLLARSYNPYLPHADIEVLNGRLLLFDGLNCMFRTMKLRKWIILYCANNMQSIHHSYILMFGCVVHDYHLYMYILFTYIRWS